MFNKFFPRKKRAVYMMWKNMAEVTGHRQYNMAHALYMINTYG